MENLTSGFWEAYGDSSLFIEVECEGDGSLAAKVLNYYGVPCNDTSGGELRDIDIKHMDALSVVKLSLLEEASKSGSFIELIVNNNGVVEFKAIGNYGGNVSDIYYTIQSMSYKEECKGVMVKGRKSRPIRKNVEWKEIWGVSGKEIYNTSKMRSNCLKEKFQQYATIVFNDPHLDSSFEDGIDNLYEITKDNPYDVILGYAKFKNPPENLVTIDTTITYNDKCSIPIHVNTEGGIPDIGGLVNPPTFQSSLYDEACWAGLGKDVPFSANKGMYVPIPEKFRFEQIRGTQVDKFENISQVYLIGMPIDSLISRPKTDADTIGEDQAYYIWASINKPSTTLIRLQEGKHYVIAYEDAGGNFKQPYIVFANNSRINDPAVYGYNKEFFIDKTCAYYQEHYTNTDIGTILPLEETKGFLVTDIWACVDLRTPCIEIYDPDGEGERAQKIAEELEYYITPLVITDEPAPIAFNGSLIDQVDGIKDHDPTTVQNFDETELERVLDIMDGGGLSISLSFLDEAQTIKLSEVLYNYMNSGSGVETTYICGPNCNPMLGGYGPSGGVINSINYSYTDGGSYTISVNEGPRLIGNMAQIDSGPAIKMSESVSMRGIVIQDLGNSIHYKVRIDGLLADRYAISCCYDIIRVGDVVQCTLHNSPVEE